MSNDSAQRKRSSKRKAPLLLDEHERGFGPKVQGKLYEDDDLYLRSKMETTRKFESEIVRILVRKGVRMDRLERASRDPNVNILMKVVDQTLNHHIARLERRLSTELYTLRRLVATTIVMANVAMRLIEAYTATQPPLKTR